jgi:hypothetical protein
VKPVRPAERAAVKHLAALETEVFQELLPLLEVVALLQYSDGSARESGWINIRTSGSAWQVSCKDPTSRCSINTTGQTFDEAVLAMVALLGSESPPWEPDAYLAAQSARKAKK